MSLDSGNHDIVWGIREIAEELNLNKRRCHYLLAKGHIPARKIGDRWISSRKALRGLVSFEADS